ncbi:hypothetical protein BKA62DRAFT_769355 [Auriculariales sp. MPI-PUGE-AT-0066]|nr:hypothetical protein BKA62DRAFT_769355 [Auriculariales sp. MPI-PUGE-AT-0066]
MEPYKAPAHQHAHHLHSIPPREKSTRTLILDRLLWMHTNARFDSRPSLLLPPPYGPESRGSLRSQTEKPQPLSPSARESSARADGLEKVLCAMLQQSPECAGHGQNGHSNGMLPNGVRLRLALGTLINEFFADLPPPVAVNHLSSEFSFNAFSSSALPTPVAPLVSISSYNALSATALSSAIASSSPLRPSSVLGVSSYDLPSPTLPFNSPGRPNASSYKVFGRTRHLYLQGASAGSGDARCLRHLVSPCEACGQISRQPPIVAGAGSGLMQPNAQSSSHGFPFRADKFRRSAASTSRLADLIIPFLRLSALVAIEMGREATEARDHTYGDHESDDSSVAGDEHGQDQDRDRERENSGDYMDSDRRGTMSPGPSDLDHDYMDTQSRADTALSMHDSPLQAFPTRGWFSLAANLFTLAALEGYLVRGWRGPDGAEVILGIGLGQNPEDDHIARPLDPHGCPPSAYEPDGMPTLAEAVRALFGGLVDDDGAGNSRSGALVTQEALAYRDEMGVRMGEFFGIAPHTPNLATHLDALVAAYPMEPMEQLALHFCKAVASWRGKPELETYPRLAQDAASGAASISEFFVVRDPALLRQYQQKRKRSAGSASDAMLPPRKRMFAGHEEEEWVGPYGV